MFFAFILIDSFWSSLNNIEIKDMSEVHFSNESGKMFFLLVYGTVAITFNNRKVQKVQKLKLHGAQNIKHYWDKKFQYTKNHMLIKLHKLKFLKVPQRNL